MSLSLDTSQKEQDLINKRKDRHKVLWGLSLQVSMLVSLLILRVMHADAGIRFHHNNI